MGLLRSKRTCFEDELDFIESEYEIEEAYARIHAYQCHLVRTWVQQSQWSDLSTSMGPNTGLLVADWAMKFEPMYHNECASEWFGKKGTKLYFF